jgi:hypothetical protein
MTANHLVPGAPGVHPTRLDKYGYEPLHCLRFGDPGEVCKGEVDEFPAPSGTGTLIAWCMKHYEQALENDRAIQMRYPVHAPADFDPDYCGERWDDDY